MKGFFSKDVLLCIALSMLVSSCATKKAEKTVEDFFDHYKNEELGAIFIYPDMGKLVGNGYKCTSFEITSSEKQSDGKILVKGTNHWINPLGVDMPTKMSFWIERNTEGPLKYIITDSKGLVSYEDENIYKFAVKIGKLSNSSYTDQQIAISLDDCVVKGLFARMTMAAKNELKNAFKLTNYEWERSDYGPSAWGSGIVTNTSSYTIDSPEYILTFRSSKNGPTVATERGYVCYGSIRPGESRSFSFHCSNCGYASWLNWNVRPSGGDTKEYYEELVLSQVFTGLEYYSNKAEMELLDSHGLLPEYY